ncbi:MAG TPA: hypothetical protein VGN83_20380 [Falsiroseomonas sp.]|jgi:hypothetical protein|nr:hypothetical protein [Falsiroseomonas sp.]
MSGWRGRLAAMRARHADADSAESVVSPAAGAIGTNGTNDTGMETADGSELEARAAFYARFAAEAAAALAVPDDDLAAERAVMALHYAAPAASQPYQPGDTDPLCDGLLAGWHSHRRTA